MEGCHRAAAAAALLGRGVAAAAAGRAGPAVHFISACKTQEGQAEDPPWPAGTPLLASARLPVFWQGLCCCCLGSREPHECRCKPLQAAVTNKLGGGKAKIHKRALPEALNGLEVRVAEAAGALLAAVTPLRRCARRVPRRAGSAVPDCFKHGHEVPQVISSTPMPSRPNCAVIVHLPWAFAAVRLPHWVYMRMCRVPTGDRDPGMCAYIGQARQRVAKEHSHFGKEGGGQERWAGLRSSVGRVPLEWGEAPVEVRG